jgi:hypothetical protein
LWSVHAESRGQHCSDKLIPDIGEGLEPGFGSCRSGVAEVCRELVGTAFEFFEQALDSVPISMCHPPKSESEVVAGGFEPRGAIDEKPGEPLPPIGAENPADIPRGADLFDPATTARVVVMQNIVPAIATIGAYLTFRFVPLFGL